METKSFPDDFSKDSADVLKSMVFGPGVKLVGSMSLRDQLYAGDYDAFETVNVVHMSTLVAKFKSIIRTLQQRKDCYIGDIKAGIVPRWNVLRDIKLVDNKVTGYDHARIIADLTDMRDKDIITRKEWSDSLHLLKTHMTAEDYYLAVDDIKFHIVRWTPADVLAGKVTLRDGTTMSLAQAFMTPTIAKLDVVSLVANNRYVEFSVIYEFVKGSKTLNPTPKTLEDIREGLKDSFNAYRLAGN